jgi:hypothetical protein
VGERSVISQRTYYPMTKDDVMLVLKTTISGGQFVDCYVFHRTFINHSSKDIIFIGVTP